MTDYLFAASGEYIGFRVDGYVFDPTCNWLGWIPRDEDLVGGVGGRREEIVYAPDGEYLGQIIDGDLLIRQTRDPRLPKPSRPTLPTRPPQPTRPEKRTRRHLQSGYSEISAPAGPR